MKLKNKVCIVTGAARGIGAGIAKLFIEEGAKVAIADLSAEEAKSTAAEMTSDGSGEAIGLAMNVTDEKAVKDGVAAVIAKWGRVDVLVCNAGIQIVHRIEDFPYEEWKRLLSIHLDGAFLTKQASLPHMYKQGAGTIILRGSVHAKDESPLKSAFVTSTHGFLGLAKVTAKEGEEDGVGTNY